MILKVDEKLHSISSVYPQDCIVKAVDGNTVVVEMEMSGERVQMQLTDLKIHYAQELSEE